MRSSYEAMHDETRELRLLDADPQKRPAPVLTLLAAVLVIVPIVVLFLL